MVFFFFLNAADAERKWRRWAGRQRGCCLSFWKWKLIVDSWFGDIEGKAKRLFYR